jgi:hypothetical protein
MVYDGCIASICVGTILQRVDPLNVSQQSGIRISGSRLG